MEIRRPKAEELYQIAEIERECFTLPWSEQSFLESLNQSYVTFLTAFDGEKAAGYCLLYAVAAEGDLCNIAVAPEYRKQGIGTQLVRALLEFAVCEQLEAVFLEVRLSNQSAISLYEKEGFVKIGIRRDFYDQPKEDAWIMKKELI